MPPKPHSSEDDPEVVKWYTRARRFPQLIGKTPDGATIWGGPYTYTQVIIGVLMIVVGAKTTRFWGHFGLIVNALVLFAVTYGVVILLGRLPMGSRNPLTVAAGAVRAISAPPRGNLAGNQIRLRRPHRARSRVVITHPTLTLTGPVASEAPPAPTQPGPGLQRPARTWSLSLRPSRVRWPSWARARPATPAASRRARPAPAATATSTGATTGPITRPGAPAPVVALTGVQRLLAATSATTDKD